MFLAKIKSDNNPQEKDIKEVIDYLFQEIKDTKAIDLREIPKGDYNMIREDVFREIKEFIQVLDDLEQKYDPLCYQFERYREALRSGAATVFDTIELTLMFGKERANYIEEELIRMYEHCRHYKISRLLYERIRLEMLRRLDKEGKLESTRDRAYLNRISTYLTKKEQWKL